MQIQSRWLTVAAALLATTLLHTGAEAQPRGWQCNYKVTPIVGLRRYDFGPYYYACYGRNLAETRARARARCSQMSSCDTGACLPLNYTPDRMCQREP